MSTKTAEKKTEQKSEAVQQPTLQFVKAIKNKLFKKCAIGDSVSIAGVILSYEMDEGTYSTFSRFKGDFRAKDKTDIYAGPRLFVPEVAESLLRSAFDSAMEAHLKGITDPEEIKKARKTFRGIEFAIWLEKVKDDDPRNARGFQWSAKPKLDIARTEDKYIALLNG